MFIDYDSISYVIYYLTGIGFTVSFQIYDFDGDGFIR